MDPQQPHGPPAQRNAGAAFAAAALLLLGIAIYGWVGLHARTVLSFSDSMDYVMLADFYRFTFDGEPPPPERILKYRHTRFPPLFPMLLGALDAGSLSQHRATLISLVFSVLAPLMALTWIRRETGSTAIATFIGAALLLYPAYFLLSLSPVSEPFALFLYALALYLLSQRPVSSSAWLVASLLVGVALLARTALLPLALAILIVAPIRGCTWRRWVVIAVLSLGPLFLWSLYRRALGAAGYMSFLTREAIVKELGGWPEALWIQPWRLFAAAERNWGPTADSVFIWSATAILTALIIVGTIVRMRRFTVDGWFLAGYIALILVWPYPFELGRFLVLVYPICLLAAVEGWQWLAQRWASAWLPRSSWIVVVLVTALAYVPSMERFLHRAALPIDPSLLDEKRELFFFEVEPDSLALENAEVFARTRILAEQIPDHVPQGECVYSTMPHLVTLYGKRNAVAYPHDLKSIDTAREALTLCRFFFLSDIDVVTYNIPGMYPAQFIKPWSELVMVSNIQDRGTVVALLRASDSVTEHRSTEAPPVNR